MCYTVPPKLCRMSPPPQRVGVEGICIRVLDDGDRIEHGARAALVVNAVGTAVRSRVNGGASASTRPNMKDNWVDSVHLNPTRDGTRRKVRRDHSLRIGRPCLPGSNTEDDQQCRASLHLADSLQRDRGNGAVECERNDEEDREGGIHRSGFDEHSGDGRVLRAVSGAKDGGDAMADEEQPPDDGDRDQNIEAQGDREVRNRPVRTRLYKRRRDG